MAAHHKSPGSSHLPVQGVIALFEQYRDKLQRFLKDRSPKTHNPNDLAQEVYLRLLRFPPHDVVLQPQAYLYRIASNVIHDFNLKLREEPVAFDSAAVDQLAEFAANPWVDDPAEQLSAEQELERVLGQLPPAHLAALLMAKRDGLSYEAIAERMGVSVHAVKKYVVRGIAQCRAQARGGEFGTAAEE